MTDVLAGEKPLNIILLPHVKIILVVWDNQATILKLDYSKPSMLMMPLLRLCVGTGKKNSPPPPSYL